MQVDSKILDDLARVAGGAIGALSTLREEAEARLRQQFEQLLSRMDLVTREEFEAVKAIATKARAEQESLAERLVAIEARLGGGGEPEQVLAENVNPDAGDRPSDGPIESV